MTKSGITLSLLRALESLSRNRNYQEVASELGVSVPTISVQISRFESNLGLDLVERSRGRGQIKLTPAGKHLGDTLNSHLLPIMKVLDELSARAR